MIRLDKYLTECGVGTRNDVKKLIRAGKISINDKVVKTADYKVDPEVDQVVYQGQLLSYEKFSYYIFHKPQGCITANSDNHHKTIMDYLPEEITRKCHAVGRLDKDTEGLILLTNDGALSHRLRSPAHHIPKTYYARLDKPVPESAIVQMKEGLDIGDDKLTKPAELTILKEDIPAARLTITEGRYHQVKRMFYAVGCEVIYLKRETLGPIELCDLPLGAYRKLTEEEISKLLES